MKLVTTKKNAIRKMGFLFLASSFCLMSSQSFSGGLIDAYEQAEKNDPQFQADFFGKQATDERYYQARSALLPQVNLSASRSDITQNITSSDNEVFDSGSTSYPTTVYGISIDQSVYDYSRWAAFSQAKLEIQQAASELEAARQDLFLRVSERYFAALALHENLSFLRAEKEQIGTNLAQVKARYEDGLAREIEFLDANARFLQVEARELDLENRLRDSLNALEEVTGKLPEKLHLVDDNLQLQRPDPDSPGAWAELAMQRNPRLQAASLAVDVSKQGVKVSRGGHFPTLDLGLNYEIDNTEGSLFGGGSEVETETIRLGLNIPVYSGGLVSSQVREGVQRIEADNARQEQVRRETARNVEASYQSIVTAMARERALRESRRASERIVESRKVGYESGVTQLLDLLDAERDLFFARSELASARYDYLANVLRLKHAAGVINVEDLAEIDALMSEQIDVVATNRL